MYELKKFMLFIVCLVLAVSVLAACETNNNNSNVNSSSSQVSSSDEQVSSKPDAQLNPEYLAYYAIVEQLTHQYGEGVTVYGQDENGNTTDLGVAGVSVVRIYDFNGDGVYEMYVAYGARPEDLSAVSVPQHQCFYGYSGGSAYIISDTMPISNGELPVSPFAQFFNCDGKVYYHSQNASKGSVHTVAGGAMQTVLNYDYDPWGQTETGPTINGQPALPEEIDSKLAEYSSKGQNDYISLYPENGSNTDLEAVLSETQEVISILKGE